MNENKDNKDITELTNITQCSYPQYTKFIPNSKIVLQEPSFFQQTPTNYLEYRYENDESIENVQTLSNSINENNQNDSEQNFINDFENNGESIWDDIKYIFCCFIISIFLSLSIFILLLLL